MIKVVIFDLDDTLISEDEYIKSGYRYLSKAIENKYSIDAKRVYEELYYLYSIDSKNVFNRFLDNHEIIYQKEDILFLVEEYRNHKPDIRFKDGVIPTLEKLKEMKIKLGIISDGYLLTQRNKADVLNLNELFDKVIFTEELGREYWKPHPKSFEIMKDYFDVEFNEMMYVGDNPEKDFYISSIYPVVTVRLVMDGVYKDKTYLENIKENYSIKKFQELFEIMGDGK